MSRIVKQKVFVGLSGGVDSSVAALLLKKQGYDVTGVFIKCYNLDGCAERDAEDARRVAGRIGIPFYTFDFEKEYKKKVVEYMIEGYRAGLTPNPDVMCNREIKFGLFLKRALALGADYVATGHYVRLASASRTSAQGVSGATPKSYPSRKRATAPVFSLFEGKDKNKDQSYFLWTLTQSELKHCLFPIGDYTKPEVRAMAKRAKLPTAEKKDSQGICFLGMVDVKDFLKRFIKAKKGAIVTMEGEVIGEHDGAAFYTIGQRHGLRITAVRKGPRDTGAHYVVAKDVKKNILVVAEGSDNPALAKKEVALTGVNLTLSPKAPDVFAQGVSGATPKSYPSQKYRPLSVFARVRYRQPLSPAKLVKISAKKYKLVFSKPQKFVAEGQSAVFYSKSGGLVGGGIIV
jgi:tRNA-specific 2-thiouridylase